MGAILQMTNTLNLYKRKEMETFTESKLLLRLYKENQKIKICDFTRYIGLINNVSLKTHNKKRLLTIEINFLRSLR